MSELNKTEKLYIRISPEQQRRLTDATEIESRRRGEAIDESTLFRELGMARVDEILANAGTPAGS